MFRSGDPSGRVDGRRGWAIAGWAGVTKAKGLMVPMLPPWELGEVAMYLDFVSIPGPSRQDSGPLGPQGFHKSMFLLLAPARDPAVFSTLVETYLTCCFISISGTGLRPLYPVSKRRKRPATALGTLEKKKPRSWSGNRHDFVDCSLSRLHPIGSCLGLRLCAAFRKRLYWLACALLLTR